MSVHFDMGKNGSLMWPLIEELLCFHTKSMVMGFAFVFKGESSGVCIM